MERRSTAPPGRLSAPPPPHSDRRFYVDPELGLALGERVELSEEAAKHARVCRLAVGDAIELFDGCGRRASATITGLWSRLLAAEITAPAATLPRGPALHLVQCMPRAGKLDDIVRMTTELGVSGIHLALSDFTVSTGARAENKLQRLERVAREALRQSEGDYIPEIQGPQPLKEVLARVTPDSQRLMLAARGGRPMALAAGDARPTWLVVGPEGGLSGREEGMLEAAGFAPTTLGPTVLRVETAAVVASALALSRLRAGPGQHG